MSFKQFRRLAKYPFSLVPALGEFFWLTDLYETDIYPKTNKRKNTLIGFGIVSSAFRSGSASLVIYGIYTGRYWPSVLGVAAYLLTTYGLLFKKYEYNV